MGNKYCLLLALELPPLPLRQVWKLHVRYKSCAGAVAAAAARHRVPNDEMRHFLWLMAPDSSVSSL